MVNSLSLKSLKSNADTGSADTGSADTGRAYAAPEAAESSRTGAEHGSEHGSDHSLNLVQSGGLKDVRDSIKQGKGSDGTGTLAAFDGANAPIIEGVADRRGEHSDFTNPKSHELYRMRVIDAEEFTQNQIMKQMEKDQAQAPELLIAPEVSVPEEEPVQYDLSFDYERRASVEFDKDGKSATVTIRDGDVRYEFKSTPNGITRTRATDRGKEEVQFDADGKPVAKYILTPDADEVATEPVNSADTMIVSTDSKGDIVLKTKDTERNTEISVVLSQDGVVKSKEEQQHKDRTKRSTLYAADGSVARDTQEKLDESGRMVERTVQEGDMRAVERFDEKGKVAGQTVYGDGFQETTSFRDDGSVQKERDTLDGKRYGVIEQPDGGKVETFSDAVNFVNQIKIINKDGSYTIGQEDKIGSSYQVGDAGGNWMSVRTPRNSNLSIISRGKGDDVYEERIRQGL